MRETLRWIGAQSRTWLQKPMSAPELGWYRALFFSLVLFLSIWFQRDFAVWASVDDVFWRPMPLGRLLQLHANSVGVLTAILWLWRGAVLLAAVGLFTRWSTAAAALLGLYVLGLPHTYGKVNHNDTMVLLGLILFALAPSGAGWSVDALIQRGRNTQRQPGLRVPVVGVPSSPDVRFGWPVQLLGLMCTMVLLTAGIAKLRLSGLVSWAASDNLSLSMLRHHYTHSPPTMLGVWIAKIPLLGRMMAVGTLGLEIGAPLLVFLRGWRRMAGLAVVISMMLGFWLILGVFFIQYVVLLLVCFLPWRALGDWLIGAEARVSATVLYDGTCGICRRTMAVIRGLDVLRVIRIYDVVADWSVIHAEYPALQQEHCLETMHVLGRGGQTFTGFFGYRYLTRLLPLCWPLLALLHVPPVPTVGERVYRWVAHRRLRANCAVPVSTRR